MLVRVGRLPESAVDAAAAFHGKALAQIISSIEDAREAVTLVFAPADHAHGAWRLAAVEGLAREYAPLRVNAVASDQETAIAMAVDYLGRAPGVTGQYFALDGNGAGDPLEGPART